MKNGLTKKEEKLIASEGVPRCPFCGGILQVDKVLGDYTFICNACEVFILFSNRTLEDVLNQFKITEVVSND